MIAHIPQLVLVIFASGAAALRRTDDRATAARLAAALSAIAAALLLGAAAIRLASDAPAPLGPEGDPLTLVLLGAATVALCALSLGAPRADIDGERLSRAFALALAFGAACLVGSTRLLAVVVALGAIPLLRRGRVAILPLMGSAAMAAGLFWLDRAGATDLPLVAQGHGASIHGAIALVWAGAWARLGLLPFHGWLPVMFERSHPAKAVLAVIANPAAIVLLRVGPSAAWSDGVVGGFLAAVAAATSLYGAFLCLGQRDLLRAVGWQAVAHAGFVVTGLVSRDPAGFAGAAAHIAASGVFLTGLTLVAWAVRARFGASPVGVAQRARHASGAFLLFGLAAAGFPGTLGFVSEDLLLHGVIEHRPAVGAVLVAATALSAIGLLRLFFRVFLGPRAEPRRGSFAAEEIVPDLFPREKAGFGVLLVALFALGLAPGPVLSAAERSSAVTRWLPTPAVHPAAVR